MFAVNDIVMYKQSGICKILDICEKKRGNIMCCARKTTRTQPFTAP